MNAASFFDQGMCCSVRRRRGQHTLVLGVGSSVGQMLQNLHCTHNLGNQLVSLRVVGNSEVDTTIGELVGRS